MVMDRFISVVKAFRVTGSDFGDYVYLWVKSKHYVSYDSIWWHDVEVLKYDESSLKDLFAQTVSAMTGFNREGSLVMIPAVKKTTIWNIWNVQF